MKEFFFLHPTYKSVLALGAESAGNYCFFDNNKISYFEDLGDLLLDQNFRKYKKSLQDFLEKNNFKPNVILVDFYSDFKTSQFGQDLAKRYSADLVTVQHHFAHAASVYLEDLTRPENFIAIACDGTGLGLDGKIWGGEAITYKNIKFKRVASLEEHRLMSGDMSIEFPARMLVSILLKIYPAEKVWQFVNKYFTNQEFTVFKNQWQQDFNCVVTSSTARVLDAVAVLLGFAENKRDYKHQPVDLLEKNSTRAYDLEPEIKNNQLSTSFLFKYLVANLDQDKQRLAATAQVYLAQGLYKLAKQQDIEPIYFSGGMANNKLMSEYLFSQGVKVNQKIPRGDGGISVGQLMYYFLTNPGD